MARTSPLTPELELTLSPSAVDAIRPLSTDGLPGMWWFRRPDGAYSLKIRADLVAGLASIAAPGEDVSSVVERLALKALSRLN